MNASRLPDWARTTARNAAPASRSNGRAVAAGLDELRELLTYIPAGCSYETWWRALAALQHATGGSGAGLSLADEWSSLGGDKYRGYADVKDHWDSYDPDGGITSAWLASTARQYGADLSEIARRHRGDLKAAAKTKRRAPKKKGDDEREPRQKQADVLIELASGPDIELFHSPDGKGFADLEVSGHRETHELKSKSFKRWLNQTFYRETGGAPNAESVKSAIGVLEARAHFDGPEREVHLRAAAIDGAIYIDLCDSEWRVIEITGGGWRINDRAPVRFRRTSSMRPLPIPERGGRLDELKRHIRVDGDDYVLLVSWLLAAFRGKGPFPILGLTGEQGTGKSVTAEMLRSLVDPSAAPLRSLPRDTRDLFIAAVNNYVLAFDNLSGISAEVSDALCRLSTGGGFSTRALYSDSDEFVLDAQRPMLSTSINDVATRSDLADRFIMVRLATIPDKDRRPEAEIRAAFNEARARIFGALLDGVAHGLLSLPDVRLNRLPRMADYATWVRACEGSIWVTGMHLAAYEKNRGDADEVVLDSSSVAQTLIRHMEDRTEYETTSGRLLAVLNNLADESTKRAQDWPKSARGLSGHLRRLAPSLRRGAGIELKFPSAKERTGITRPLIITKTEREGETQS